MSQPFRSVSCVFKAELSSLHSMLAWIRREVRGEDFLEQEMRRIEVALEEAFVNIIHYAYQDQGGIVEITYNHYLHQHIEIIFKDYGIPFNPITSSRQIDRLAPLEKRKVGGLGISFMKELMDEMEYLRDGEANILTLKKICK